MGATPNNKKRGNKESYIASDNYQLLGNALVKLKLLFICNYANQTTYSSSFYGFFVLIAFLYHCIIMHIHEAALAERPDPDSYSWLSGLSALD